MPPTNISKSWSTTPSFRSPSVKRPERPPRGQTAGWKIDIKSEEEKRQEVEQQMSALVTQTVTPLENVTGLGEGLVEKLKAAA